MTATAKLDRQTFTTSRTLEFFSEKELSMQIGHERFRWPAAILKELVDNALDACEAAGIPPEIHVVVEQDALTVTDNGPGIPPDTVQKSLNYFVRVSDKLHYTSPSRGQLGNALKCVWAAPFVDSGERGLVEVHTARESHRIEVSVDRIAQAPRLTHTVEPGGIVRNGTSVKVHWPGIAGYLHTPGRANLYNLLDEFAAFNPHAAFSLEGEPDSSREGRQWAAGETTWRKWTPSTPTSAHWYTVERFTALIAAYVHQERNGGEPRTVRQFVSEFMGLSGSAKQKAVCEAAGLSRAGLHALAVDGQVDRDAAERLLGAMQESTKPVKPKALGVIGEEHIRGWFDGAGFDLESMDYRAATGTTADGLPFVLEAALGVYGQEYDVCGNRIITGLNWTPALEIPFAALNYLLRDQWVAETDPVGLLVHLACPHLDFTDRGKGRLALPAEITEALKNIVRLVTKRFAAEKRKNAREAASAERLREALRKEATPRYTAKEAAFEVMAEAYAKASGNGRYPANARQVMYAARPAVIELTGKTEPWKETSYFTQVLLPEFLEANPELTASWDVVFDARGKLIEPHTRERVDLGTLEVRRYISSWSNGHDTPGYREVPGLPGLKPTSGPKNRYEFALFIEKEGFNPQMKAERIAERFDVAVMSTKGLSVTAARHLVEELSKRDVTILVVRDFDKAGFSIVHTLSNDTRRYTFTHQPKIVDLGLRLSDVIEMDLQSEKVSYRSDKDPRENLRESGASEEECDFLVHGREFMGRWRGERVELNSMTTPQFIEWLERKLTDAGVRKVVPDEKMLQATLRAAVRREFLQEGFRKLVEGYEEPEFQEENLVERIAQRIDGAATSWDEAIRQIAGEVAHARG